MGNRYQKLKPKPSLTKSNNDAIGMWKNEKRKKKNENIDIVSISCCIIVPPGKTVAKRKKKNNININSR